jgi:hypothetical protein
VKVRTDFKILTFLCIMVGIFSLSPIAFSKVLDQSEFKTHLRWKVNSKKKQILINKSDNQLVIQTLDKKLFNELITDLLKLQRKTQYIKDFKYEADKLPAEPATLTVNLASDSIELFSFYKDQSNNYVVDFWENKDTVITKKAAIVKKPQVLKLAKPKSKPVAKKRVTKKKLKISKITDVAVSGNVLDPENIIDKNQETGYRDFRYGAAFIWDYEAFIPPLEKDIIVSIKTPDYLYQIKDREFSKDKKEAHMQLTINLYRKEKWGLMTRSINLYESSYGQDSNKELNDFLKANSLIRNVIKPTVKVKSLTEEEQEQVKELTAAGEPIPNHLKSNFSSNGTFQAGVNLLTKVAERTNEYDLKKAANRYILQYALDKKDFVKALQIAKRLYVSSTEQFDDEIIIYSSRVILYSLANLKQLSKIQDFLSNKAVIRVLPKQEGYAYIGFVNLAKGETTKVINIYEANKRSLAKPVHPAILYNTAEAYFRNAEYEKAIRLNDEYVAQYSFYKNSSNSRLRIALSYDLLNRDIKKVLALYKSSINSASSAKIRYESKLRYVGVRASRKRSPSDEDKETVVFLDQSPAERKSLDDKLRKLLWLVRVRSMINFENYNKAITYLSTIPVESLRSIDKRTFEGEGSEIVLGLIKKAYLDEDYSKAVKVWEIYKNKYEEKVAKSTYLSFIVSDSYLRLGFDESFKREFNRLKSLSETKVRTFPKWVKNHKNIKIADYIAELEIEKLKISKDWNGLRAYLQRVKDKKNINYNFYNGLVSYNLKEYTSCVASYEKILVKPNINNVLSPTQSQTMLTTYIESLYQGNDPKRFRKNVAALVNDLRRTKGEKYKAMLERFDYLYIESLFGSTEKEGTKIFKLLLTKTKEFLAAYKETAYKSRVKFLNGVSLIQNSQEANGKKILESLLDSTETPEYLKGLARTELSTLAIEKSTL